VSVSIEVERALLLCAGDEVVDRRTLRHSKRHHQDDKSEHERSDEILLAHVSPLKPKKKARQKFPAGILGRTLWLTFLFGKTMKLKQRQSARRELTDKITGASSATA
jgi:hypothetical protein